MKRKVLRTAAVVLVIAFLSAAVSGCSPSANQRFDPVLIKTYRDIPGITGDEIQRIETIKSQRQELVFSSMVNTESFTLPDGTYAGFTPEFCKLLSDLFGIPFTLRFNTWEELNTGLNDLTLDFTGEFTPTPERRERYYMTNAIAERTLSVFMKDHSLNINKATDLNGLNIGFFDGAITPQAVAEVYSGLDYNIVALTGIEDARRKLLSGEIDAVITDSTVAQDFASYISVISADVLPLVYTPVSMTTANPELAPIISVMDKYITAGGIDVLYEMYMSGEAEYSQYAFKNSLSPDDLSYLNDLTATGKKVPIALEHDNYPVCFYDEQEDKFSGIAVDILEKISALTGIEFEIKTDKNTTWAQILESLRQGEVSLVSQLIYSDERANSFIWPDQPYFTSRFAFVSKAGYPNVKMYQVVRSKVGISDDTAYEDMYKAWFPDDSNVIYYDTFYDVFNALERGDVELALVSEAVLLLMTNYREMPGYKVNLAMDYPLEESYFGLNKSQTELCSIISKAMEFTNTQEVGDDWTSRVYDYSQQLAQFRLIIMSAVAISLLLILCIVFMFLIINNRKGKTISKQAGLIVETNQRLQTLLDLMPLGVAVLSVDDHTMFYANRAAIEIFGCSEIPEEQLIGRNGYDFFPETQPDGRVTLDTLNEFLRGEDTTIELQCRKLDGKPFVARINSVKTIYNGASATLSVIEDMTSEQEYLTTIREARENLQALLDMLPIGVRIMSMDDGSLLYSNQSCLKVFNCSSFDEQVRGHNGMEFMPEYQPDGRKTAELVEEFNNSDADVLVAEMQCLKLGGEPFTCRITSRVINYLGHRASLASMEDVTAEEEYRQTLRNAALKEQEANQLKSRFLATMSHEIRTPMNAIIGLSELALRDESLDAVKEHVFTINQAGSNLLAIINDILDFSKIEAGKMEIKSEDYSISSLLNDVISIIKIRAANTGLRFAVKVDSQIPHSLYGDETRIRQAVLNLLINAVKYTEKGFVSFSVFGEFTGSNVVKLTFEVADSGIGIKKENIDLLFTDFTQFDLERNRNIEGVGLGLAITNGIVNAMDGTISVKSEYGKGSTFTIALPQQYRSREPLAAVENAMNKTVLIYERRVICAESLKYTVENLGVKCTLVKNGTQLYERMYSRKYDYLFIASDLFNKNEDTIKKLGINTKIVLLAEFGEAIPEKNISVLAMPLYCTMIADVLNGIYGSFSYSAAGESSAVNFAAPDARVLVVDDINTNLKVTEGFLSPYKMRIDLCNSGMEAIQAVQSARYDLIFMDHKMPIMDGVETTQRIRAMGNADSYYEEVPIVALTANAVAGMNEMFMKNGFSDFLSKPIQADRLNAILETWIPESKRKRADIESIDAAKELAAFCADMTKKISMIEDCLDSGNLSLYAFCARDIKTTAATVGAVTLSRAAEVLEAAGELEDIAFIRENHDYFIDNAKTILDNIKGGLDTETRTEVKQ